MALEALLDRLHREARNQAEPSGTTLVPAPEAPKPADFREKSEAGTNGTNGTTHNKRGGAKPHDDGGREALARDDRQRGGDVSAHRARAAALIERCRAAGVSLRLDGRELRVGRVVADHSDLADELREHRYDVLVELRAREGLCFVCGEPAPPVSTMPSGEPVHVDCLDAAVSQTLGDWGTP